jgi:hypothetical protein
MKLFVTFLLLVPVVSAFAQNPSTLRAKYGNPRSETFVVREGVIATFTYGKDGKPTELRVAPDKPGDEEAVLPNKTIDSVFQEMVPEKTRGEGMFGELITGSCPMKCNCIGGSVTGYVNVSIYYNGGKNGTRYAVLKWNTEKQRQANRQWLKSASPKP